MGSQGAVVGEVEQCSFIRPIQGQCQTGGVTIAHCEWGRGRHRGGGESLGGPASTLLKVGGCGREAGDRGAQQAPRGGMRTWSMREPCGVVTGPCVDCPTETVLAQTFAGARERTF